MIPDASNRYDSVSLRELVRAASSEPAQGGEEEAALAEAAARGDAQAIEGLVRLHLRDAVDEAIRHRGDVGVSVLIRQGVRSLVAAARRYDPERHGPFPEYAREAVRRDVRRASLPETQ